MKCKRCSGIAQVISPSRDGGRIKHACPVCKGSGVAPRRRYQPPDMSGLRVHFLADEGWKEHDQFMDWLTQEVIKHEWFRTQRANSRQDHHREVPEGVDADTSGTDKI